MLVRIVILSGTERFAREMLCEVEGPCVRMITTPLPKRNARSFDSCLPLPQSGIGSRSLRMTFDAR